MSRPAHGLVESARAKASRGIRTEPGPRSAGHYVPSPYEVTVGPIGHPAGGARLSHWFITRTASARSTTERRMPLPRSYDPWARARYPCSPRTAGHNDMRPPASEVGQGPLAITQSGRAPPPHVPMRLQL